MDFTLVGSSEVNRGQSLELQTPRCLCIVSKLGEDEMSMTNEAKDTKDKNFFVLLELVENKEWRLPNSPLTGKRIG